ncbi:PREDICTED: ras association domain-containing protein 9-like [Nicrophorus vespilloides]|uniref:Ras association domain-containing protein 9-like n=1 Tax=Nicrophorus vespilloides TaxID=110193 RepID=A0ABM1LZZ5_NICVS|nr:PREDICTED: ras association domain-containing protein 9-like [Nicrophorus vespilloides]
MMWIDETNRENESGSDSDTSGEELPIWVRGEQRWVSGVVEETTCQDIIGVLLHDEENRGKQVGTVEDYHITERWRGVEQLLDPYANILHIWNAWGTAQPEVKISLRRIKNEGGSNLSRKSRYRSNASLLSERSAFKTIHPKRLAALQNEKQPSSTEELLKLVLAQGKVIRKQLKKLRHSEHQIGFLEDKTHKARIQKHGRNYLLETYLKGLSEAVEPELDNITLADKNSDSGVLTEGDSEQSNNNNKLDTENSFDRFSSPSSHEFSKDLRDDDTSSTISEATAKEQIDLYERIAKLNKRLLKEEEALARLYASMKKYNKTKSASEDVNKSLTHLRTRMAKSSCEMQHNEVVLEETKDAIESRRSYLDTLHRDLVNEDQEFDMLQTLLYSINLKAEPKNPVPHNSNYTKELLDTLV